MTILKEKLTLPCGAQIKNRICKAAMTERIAFSDNYTIIDTLIFTKNGLKEILEFYSPAMFK